MTMRYLLAALAVTALACDGNDGPYQDGDASADSDTDSDTDSEQPEQCVRYVDVASGATSPDGMTWGTAFTCIQDGLDAAFEWVAEHNGDDADLENPYTGPRCEVWVAAGVYYVHATSPDDTLLLRPNVRLYGGFDGTEVDFEQRDAAANQTVISGHEGDAGLSSVCHVVTGDDQTVIDGFTITGGDATQAPCAVKDGGGMYSVYSEEFTVAHDRVVSGCVFEGNRAHDGGGMYSRQRLTDLLGCSFIDNTAEGSGGGLHIDSSEAMVRDCLFEGNEAGAVYTGFGGGLFVEGATYSSPSVTNCVFLGNTGGGVYNYDSSTALTNCTFAGNDGTALRNEWYSDAVVTGCIVWGNGASIVNPSPESESVPVVTYSDVEGGYPGAGNIDADPLFADDPEGDLSLQVGSPCIDAADGDAAPSLDMVGYPRADDPTTPDTGVGAVTFADMGALEHQI